MTLAGVLPMLFWALLASEGEIVEAIEFGNLVLVPFHTPYFNFGQREPKLLAFQLALLSCCLGGPEHFHSKRA